MSSEQTSISVGQTHEVEALISGMTLAEKVGQMTQVELGSITPDEAAEWGIGSVLSGGGGNPGDGSKQAWRDGVEAYVAASLTSRLSVPLLYGVDAVHGHNNVRGATIFPHNIAMGATGDPDLMRRVSRAAALETAATGVRWSFAPCLAVPQDVRWGRTYEGFSQDPNLVAAMGAAAVQGWHGDDLVADGVLACVKHFVGEGAMVWGSAGTHRHPWIDWWDEWTPQWQIDQGDITIDEPELRRTHLLPFERALEAGAKTVMACYASWHGTRLHGHQYLLTDVLKGELGFVGFVVSDWMAVDQLDVDYPAAVAQAIGAGVDMVMVPFDYRRFIASTIELVETGAIEAERIDDAVRRILSVKSQLGLFGADGPGGPGLEVIGCDEHRDLAREAVGASAVILSGETVLPMPGDAQILAAGEALDDVGICCGGWTVTWEGSKGTPTPGSTMLDGLVRLAGASNVTYDAEGRFDGRSGPSGGASVPFGIVTIHEDPYVEGAGDRADLSIPGDQLDVVRRVREQVDHLVVLVVSGRPLVIEPVVELADAIVACWLPGTESDGIAEVLLGQMPFAGMLPVAWPGVSSMA